MLADALRPLLHRLDRTYRRTGANLPLGDPRASHGAEMEGYFWRVSDVAGGRVLVVLCGVNRHPAGAWATVAVAAHPGGVVRSAVLPGAWASTGSLHVEAGGGAFEAGPERVEVDLGPGARARLELNEPVAWPRALGGGGLFSAVPFLGQYWHPHVLGGTATVRAEVGDERWRAEGAAVYAEKNWGAGFPARWWWGQAQGFERPDVCVAFSGGVLTAGPLAATVGGAVVRVGADVVRFTPPLGRVRSEADGRRWSVEARRPGQRLRIEGEAVGEPHVLPVPVPAERRNAPTDLEHLAGRLHLRLEGRVAFEGASRLAGLEVGWRPGGAAGV